LVKSRRQQQWWFNEKTKCIHSNLWKNYGFHMSGNNLYTRTVNARWFQLFRYKNGYLVNERGKVVEVSGNVDTENRNVVVGRKRDRLNQQWDIMYYDEMPPELKKGDLNKEWGMRISTDFHIVSKMSSQRYIDRIGNNVVLKTPNDRNT